MSFGWSAGDIATAIKTTYSLYRALDSCDGAASEYREAVFFLKDLIRTLEPLRTFADLRAYPIYAKDIEDQVVLIKEPVDDFLQSVLRYEPSLGAMAKSGHHRNLLPKLKWHFSISKKALALRDKVQSHIRNLDFLMQRLTL